MLFDCQACGGLCCRSSFESLFTQPQVSKAELEANPALCSCISPEYVLLPIEGPDGPQCRQLTPEKTCGIYEHRPIDCRVYPLFPYGDQVVVHAMCPDALSFCYKLAADDPEAVAFFRETVRTFQEMDRSHHDHLERIASQWRFRIVCGYMTGIARVRYEDELELYAFNAQELMKGKTKGDPDAIAKLALYGSRKDQVRRFEVIEELLRPYHMGEYGGLETLLDVGCGTGDLAEYLPMVPWYTGIDPVVEVVEIAAYRNRMPSSRAFFVSRLEDMQSDPALRGRSWHAVVASGAPVGRTPAELMDFIGRMWEVAEYVVVFNGLSTVGYQGVFEPTSPSMALEVALRFTGDVTLVHTPEVEAWTIRMVRPAGNKFD